MNNRKSLNMTSKDELINIFNQSTLDENIGTQREVNDIKEFQECVRVLFIELRTWLEGMPITIERDMMNIHNSTLSSTKSYPIDSMKISNENKHLEFQPEALY